MAVMQQSNKGSQGRVKGSQRGHMKGNQGDHSKVLKSARTPSKLGTASDREKVEAAIFFLRFQEWMTKKYIDEIRTMYLNPLVEWCSGKKRAAESVSKSGESANNSSTRGAVGVAKVDGGGGGNVAGMDKVADRLQQALKTLQQGDGGEMTQSYRPVAREKTVSLADCCALYRLKTLLEAMQDLLDIQAGLNKWFDHNKANMDMHKGSLKNLLTNALTNFEMAYTLTELFTVQKVPREEIQKVKPEYSKYIRPDDGSRNVALINKPLSKGVPTREYIKKLEGQINHFRTVVYEIAKNLEIIIETIVANFGNQHLEVNTKQVAMIIDNLPPRYRFAETIHLSPFAKKLLANVPPIPDNVFGDLWDSSSRGLTKSGSLTERSFRSKSSRSHRSFRSKSSRSHRSHTGSGSVSK